MNEDLREPPGLTSAAKEAKPLFDLSEADGVNESERILTKLCKQSFLRLWSYTNVFTDEGFKDGKGGAKELTDALVTVYKRLIAETQLSDVSSSFAMEELKYTTAIPLTYVHR